MDIFKTIFALSFVANSAIIVMLAVSLARFWREIPWLGVLLAYFVVAQARGVHHIWHMVSVDRPAPDLSATDVLLSVASMVVLVALALSMGRLLNGLRATRDAAAYREEEYGRAHRHYTQLMRHRILNPVTVIRGAAITLQPREGVDLDDETRGILLDAVLEASDAIEQATFEPIQTTAVEGELNAVPNIPARSVSGSRPRLVLLENKATSRGSSEQRARA